MVRVWLDGFAIEFSRNEEGGWVASFAKFPELSASGSTPENALAELGLLWKLVRHNHPRGNEALVVRRHRKDRDS
jgi:hypothetical protein